MNTSLLSLCLFLFSLQTFAQVSDFWHISFKRADSVALLYRNRDLKNIQKLTEDLTKPFTMDVEKFRVVFRWVTDNISYDVKLYSEDKRKQHKYRYDKKRLQRWNKSFAQSSYRRMINRKTAVCSGYSVLLEQMASYALLNCSVINGYARTLESPIGKGSVNHAWNAVQLDGKWYLCDATWASGYVDRDKKFYKRFNENYFLTDPSLLIADHYPKDPTWKLLYNGPSLQDFLQAPIKSHGYFNNKINSYSPLKGVLKVKKGNSVKFEFTSNAASGNPDATVWLDGKKFTADETYKLYKDNAGKYFINCDLFQKRGSYSLYIFINRQLTFLYQIRVT